MNRTLITKAAKNMNRKPARTKYRAIVLKRTTAHVCNHTGQPVNITAEEGMIDAFRHDGIKRYTFVELFEKVGEITGNTYAELDAALHVFCTRANDYSLEVYLCK